MDRLKKYIDDANKAFNIADHMAHTTYNLIKDPKLILLGLTHLNTALDNGVSALLYYDYLFKRISFFPKEEASKMDIFKRITTRRYNIPREVVQAVMDVGEIMQDHKASEMEFRRKNKFIIASKNYRLRTLTIEKLKKFIQYSKPLIKRLNEIKLSH